LVLSNFIDQIFIYGDSKEDCCVGIIVANPEAAMKWSNGKSKDLKVICDDKNFNKDVKDEL
jgi:long-subunit acyl-CoA synthetase (AMP-forming)